MSAWLAWLNAHHHGSGRVRWERGPGGLVFAQVDAPACTARLALQGGQLLHWQPRGMAPVLWCSPQARYAPGTPIRGGVPVCWPWFGPHPERDDFPAHGFARTALWMPVRVAATGAGVALRLALVGAGEQAWLWPHRSRLHLDVQLDAALTLRLETEHRGPRPCTLSQALHAYFAVSDVAAVRLHGLAGHRYHDKVRGVRHRQRGPLRLQGETDRVYLRHLGAVRLEDPQGGRCIEIRKRGSRSTVVWNPGAAQGEAMADVGRHWREMLCVEAADALDDRRTLLPGARHRLEMQVRCRPL